VNREPKISIIIPVYNGAACISRCVDSVLNQTFRDVEILLMNDGSADNSLELLRAYEAKHPQIAKVHSHGNMGVAKTRNEGIRLAHAKYIMFLDQDDFIDPDYCETYFKAIETSGSDIVMGGYRRPNAAGKIVKKLTPRNAPYYKYMIMAGWAKIHRTAFLIDNNILFFDNAIGEDIIFTLREISATERLKIIPYTGYNWFFNEASVSNTNQRGLNENIDALIALLDEIFRIENTDALFEYCVVRTMIYCLLYCGKTAAPADFIRCERILFRWLQEHYPHYTKNKYVRFPPKGEAGVIASAVMVFLLLRRMKLIRLFARIYCCGRTDE
jgi:glycosyltransferase involved in cell wall biosynthesis